MGNKRKNKKIVLREYIPSAKNEKKGDRPQGRGTCLRYRDSHFLRLVLPGAPGAAETVEAGLAEPLPREVERREKPRPRGRKRDVPEGCLEEAGPPRAVELRNEDRGLTLRATSRARVFIEITESTAGMS